MPKKQSRETYDNLKASQGEARSRYNEAIGGAKAEQERLQGQASPLRDELLGSFRNLADRGSYQGINASTGNLKDFLGRVKEFSDTGGYSKEREASIMENVAGLKDIGKTGGLSTENVDRIRGLGGFEEFSKTGGYTPEAIANIKKQALSPIGAYATGTQDELGRRMAVQGGYGPGFDAANRQLRRDTSRAIADTSLNANVGIQDRINEGRKWGIGGLSDAETKVAGMQSANKLAGLTSAADVEMQLQNSISNYRAQGLSMEQATARAIDDIETNVGMFNESMAQNRIGMGLQGMGGIYGSDVDQYQSERDRELAALGGMTNADLGYFSQRTGLASQPGIGNNIIGGIGAGAGIAADWWGRRNRGNTGVVGPTGGGTTTGIPGYPGYGGGVYR